MSQLQWTGELKMPLDNPIDLDAHSRTHADLRIIKAERLKHAADF